MEKSRTAISLLLAVVGAGLLVYGLLARTAVVSSGDQGLVAATSELSITQEVTRGGVKRDESGNIKKTYGEGEKAPAACPT
jgi:hypothetical protein